MNLKRIATARLRIRFFMTHLMHRLFHRPADVICGRKFSSCTFDPFTHHMRGVLRMGKAVKLGRGIDLNIRAGGELSIGSNVRITGNTYICADEKVTIGDNVLIAEFCTIRDSDHGIAADRLICDQPGTSLPVTIGSDVWIGAGCAILKGATVPDGCVIGAHSVVLRNSKLVPGGIYAGTPVRLIRMRAPETPQK